MIYNITPNANITLAPMTIGPTPNLLGYFIVKSGPTQTPSNAPNVPPGPTYGSCQNLIVLTNNAAPASPNGGEFLHGLGFIDGANLGFNDLTEITPNLDGLRNAVVNASKSYYATIDPNSTRTTLAEFKTSNGFVVGAAEVTTRYANSGDLGFGRDMHCLKKATGDVACYVTNYGIGYTNISPGAGTNDQLDANAAAQQIAAQKVATVAMEYSPIENDPTGQRVVKYYVYGGDDIRNISANLDGRGERPVPQLCMICHGGLIPEQTAGIPAFNTPAQVKLNSRFLPFDHRFFTFPTVPGFSKANQEANFKTLNRTIVLAAPPVTSGDPIFAVVQGMYGGTGSGLGSLANQALDFSVPGWVNGTSGAFPDQEAFYKKVIANDCRTCHIAQPFASLKFDGSAKFVNLLGNDKAMLGTAQSRVCGDYTMPHALRTHELFWDTYTVAGATPPPNAVAAFQSFGNGVGGSTWKPGLCSTFISGTVSSPSLFYKQTIQPIFNGKCLECHTAQSPRLIEMESFAQLVPGKVVPGNDNPAAPGNILLERVWNRRRRHS